MTTDSSLARSCWGMVFAALVGVFALGDAIKSIQAVTTPLEMLSIPLSQPKSLPRK